MKERLLRLCLLAYPRNRRERDGEILRDLATELARNHGFAREALSLIRGGLSARIQKRRSSTASASTWGRHAPSVVGFLFGTGLLVTGFVTGGSPILGWLTVAVFVGWAVTAVLERLGRKAGRRRATRQ